MKYGGSHFFMDREGEYSEYKRFNITHDQEMAWIKEYRSELLAKLASDPTDSDAASEICGTVSNYKDYLSVQRVLDIASGRTAELDSFSKLRYAEEFHRIISNPTFSGADHIRAALRSAALILLQDLMAEPITVAPHYRSLSYLQEHLTKNAITERAERELNRLNCEPEH